MASFATPYWLRYGAHCFNRAFTQNKRPPLTTAGGELGVTPVSYGWGSFAGESFAACGMLIRSFSSVVVLECTSKESLVSKLEAGRFPRRMAIKSWREVQFTGGARSTPCIRCEDSRIYRGMARILLGGDRNDSVNLVPASRDFISRNEFISEGLHEQGVVRRSREYGLSSRVISSGPLVLKDRAMKRAMDLLLAVPATILLVPVFLAIAFAIKLEDRGPVLFIQVRTGRANRNFRMLKFRSMKVGQLDFSGAMSTTREDERTTRVGRVIRRTSLDELPQLLNVVRGDMSLVGPRPHALRSRAGNKLFWEIDPRYWNRHQLKPGMSGLAQIRGYRGPTVEEKQLVERLNADLEYVDQWSLRRDIIIIFRTIVLLMRSRAF